MTTLATAVTGTANSAPGMPASSTPAVITMITASGCTRTARPSRKGCSTWPSSCATPRTPASMASASTGPSATKATSTATDPLISEPTIGTKAPRNTSTPSGIGSGTPSSLATTATPIPSTAATTTVARTKEVSVAQASSPAPCTRGRTRDGNSPTSHPQIRSPPDSRKNMLNSTSRRPAPTSAAVAVTCTAPETTWSLLARSWSVIEFR